MDNVMHELGQAGRPSCLSEHGPRCRREGYSVDVLNIHIRELGVKQMSLPEVGGPHPISCRS